MARVRRVIIICRGLYDINKRIC